MEDHGQLPEESYEQEDIVDSLTQGMIDELLEEIAKTDSSEDIVGTVSSEKITQFSRALEEYHRFIDQAKELAKEKLEQRRNDNLTYNRISIVVRGTKEMDIEYGVEGQVQKDHIGRPYPPFEDTEILNLPKVIKKALRGQEES